jgi:hypothetical protein
MLGFLNRLFCAGERQSGVEAVKTNLIETKESSNEIDLLKATIENLQSKEQTYQNILAKLRDQLDVHKAGETINQLEVKIRKLNAENLKLQENSVNVDGVHLNYFVEKMNIFATGFKASFYTLVKTQQSLNPKPLTHWNNIEVSDEYESIIGYINQENLNVHKESLDTMKTIMEDVIRDLVVSPEFIESASQASQGF